jgi:ParB family chromosome partitioning protein
LSKELSASSLTRGLLVDIDIYRIKHPHYHSRTARSQSENSARLTNELSKSIARQGLLQPIIVRAKAGTAYFEIVAGNRRYDACKALGWRKIICHVLELDDKEAFEVTLIENIQRENLNPIEEAYAFKIYVEKFGWGGISDLASRLGKSVSYVDKRIRLLSSPPELIESVSNRSIGPSIAEELNPVHDQHAMHKFVSMISKTHLSSRKVRKLVKEYKQNSSSDIYDTVGIDDKIVEIDKKVQHSFDKSIVAIRIAASRLASIIENIEENWIIYEILMQHKIMLNSQIDILIKEKKKL